MKKVNAIWEKRNLGVDTIEITFDKDDSLEKVEQLLKELDAEYIVLKVPTDLPDLLPIVQDNGYRYIEDMIYLSNYLQNISRNPIENRLHNAITVEQMNDEDMNILYKEIKKGIFVSDRVYLDPYFSHSMAQRRYINWIQDEKTRGTEFLKYVYKNKAVGFFSLREITDRCYLSFIGGIYKEFRKGGIGTIVKVPEEVRKRKGKKVSTSVSTNNMVQIRSLIKNGYIPENIMHTFIQHF